jgi:hypothetical protein
MNFKTTIMKKLFIFIFTISSLSVFCQSKNANIFALNIGNFANPEIVDFAALQKLGLIYAVTLGNDQSQIFVGDYPDKSTANTALTSIKKAFPEAYIAQKKATTTTISTVQLASKKVGEKINWKSFENAGNIFAVSDGKIVRIVSAGFQNDSLAKIALSDLKALGYKDAILKKYPEVNLHKIAKFESGLDLNGAIKKQAIKSPAKPPSVVVLPPPPPIVIDNYAGNYPTSELKRSLSVLGTYKGKVDDKANPSLTKAFEEATLNNSVLAKYKILAKSYKLDIQKVSDLQQAINNIQKDPAASAKTLEKSMQPIAKAYRAYLLFTQNGDAKIINSLMNEALQTAFKDTKENKFSFDASATYDYKELAQLIKHLRYVQGAAKDEPTAPTWLFTEHPKEAKVAFTGDYKVEPSDPAMDIEAVRLTKLIADDMVANATKDTKEDLANASERTKMMLNPVAVTESQDDWNKQLWEGLDTWAAKDALNQQTVKAFKASFYQSVVLLQQQYAKQMGLPNSPQSDTNSRNAALLLMKSIVKRPLAQYGRRSKGEK